MKTSGVAWQETHVSGVMDGGVRGLLDHHRLRHRAKCRAPDSTLQTSRCSASLSPVPDPSRELLPGRAGPVRSGCCPRVSSLGASVTSASGLGRWLCTLEFSAVLSQRKKERSQPHPPASLCVRLSRNFSGQFSKKAPAPWPFPHQPPLLPHARGVRHRPWRAPVGL